MHALLNIALRAARDAAVALAHQTDRLDRIKVLEDSEARFVTSADKDADTTIIYHLQKSLPSHAFSSRVSGKSGNEDATTVWLIDPLVGNRNFMRGIPRIGVSIACQIDNIVRHAVYIDPLLNEEYTASRGSGSHLNGRRLRVSDRTSLVESLITLDCQSQVSDLEDIIAWQRALVAAGAGFAVTGGCIQDILHTASGRYDAGLASNPGRHTLAASTLILEEAGGLLSSINGDPDVNRADSIVFGNPKCLRQLIQMRKSAVS